MPKPTITLHDLRNQGEITPEWCREHGASPRSCLGLESHIWCVPDGVGVYWHHQNGETWIDSDLLHAKDIEPCPMLAPISTIAQLAALLLAFGLAELDEAAVALLGDLDRLPHTKIG